MELFQKSKADFYQLPAPLVVLDGRDDVIKLGPTAYQLTHAFGSVTPSVNTTKSDTDLIDTVKADSFSIGAFFAFPIIIYLINFVHRKLIKKYIPSQKTERGATVLVKLIRILLNQPNYTPADFNMRIMISLCLFSTLFVLTVYRNIFGSDLTVTDGAVDLDTIEQMKESDRFVIFDATKLTKQMVFGSTDPLSKFLQSRTVPEKSDWGMTQINQITASLVDKDAAIFSNLIYHQYFAGGYCSYMIDVANVKEPSCRYHVSRQRFMPMVTCYVYGKRIEIELKRRLDWFLTIHIENGIEGFQAREKPRLAFFATTGNDNAYFCTLRKEEKEESYPNRVSLKALRKTILLCALSTSASIVVFIFEIFTKFAGSKLQLTKEKKKKNGKTLKWNGVNPQRLGVLQASKDGVSTYQIRQEVSYGEKLFQERWLPVQMTQIKIRKVTPLTTDYKINRLHWQSAHVTHLDLSEKMLKRRCKK